MPAGLTIRPETAGDAAAVRLVLADAFQGPAEARLVEALRASGALEASLVAVAAGRVLGHAAVSRVTVAGTSGPWFGLGPVAVAPDAQGRGIGRRLVARTVAAAEAAGAAALFVLGHPAYYAALGFEEAAPAGWRCIYQAPSAAFRVRRLDRARLPPTGTVRYHAAFDAP